METLVRTSAVDGSNPVDLLAGLLIDGLAGFEASLLLAPQSGIKTHAQIKQKSTKLQVGATDTLDDLVTLSRFDKCKILAVARNKLRACQIRKDKTQIIVQRAVQANAIVEVSGRLDRKLRREKKQG